MKTSVKQPIKGEDSRPTLLVFIPCWVNFPQAIHQAKALRHQYFRDVSLSSSFKLEIICSINAVSELPPSSRQALEESFDELSEIEATTGDLNINMGFFMALRRKSDFLWILSPDDTVSDSALSTIDTYLIKDERADFLVSNEEFPVDETIELTMDSLDLEMISSASFGLVTGVVYRVKNFRSSLHLGLQASFTHWGQVAVLLGSLRDVGRLMARLLFAELLYFRGDSKNLADREFSQNVGNYSGSFFGYVVLLALLKPNSRSELKKWVRANFFHIGMYKRAYYASPKRPMLELTNLHIQARNFIRIADPFHFIIFRMAEAIDFSRFRELAKFGRGV